MTIPPVLTVADYDPFAGPELASVAPMTEAQAEIWLACQFGGDDANRAYNESVSLRLTGALDTDAFVHAWASVVRRHEALRAVFSPDGHLCILADGNVPLTIHNLRDIPSEAVSAVSDLAALDARHLFDLENGPLAKATLLTLSDTAHHFTLTAHHIICDGWSSGVLLEDLGTFYSAYVRGTTPSLTPAPQISQYTLDERAFLSSAAYLQTEAFWLAQYQEDVPVLNLPTDVPRPKPRTYAGDRYDVALPATLVQQVKQTGTKAGSSLVSTLTAAFEYWLHRQTGQPDVVLGLPAAGQPVAEQDRLVGHCVSLLPLRSRHVPGEDFGTYLRRRRPELLDAFDHSRLTFGRLLKKLPIKRDPSRVALVPVVFNVDMGLDAGIQFEGLERQLISNPRAYENFELSLNATGSEQTLILEWSYNKRLFSSDTIARFHTSFVALLEEIVGDKKPVNGKVNGALNGVANGGLKPTATFQPALPGFPHESPSDDRKVAVGFSPPLATPFNDAHAPTYSRATGLTTLLANTAARFPDKIAVRFKDEAITFGELDRQANRVGHALRVQGIRPGDRVGLAVDRSLALLLGMIGIMKAGATYVPVDPQHPTDRITYILTDADCQAVLTSEAHTGRFALPDARELIVEALWPTLETYPDTAPDNQPDGAAIAYILYTSGTTGRPKGALIRHHSVANVLFSIANEPGLTAADKTIALATIAFDLAVVEIYTPLLVGAELLLIDPATARNGEALATVLADPTITFIQTTPATLRLLLEAGWRGHSTLRLISCAEALPMDLAQTLMKQVASLWNYYGPTETTIYATGKRILPTDERVTIGRAIANTRIYLLDENGQQAAEGQPGELCIAGEGVSNGYLNQPELTAEKFIDSPFAAGEKLYRTGDLGRYLDGGSSANAPSTADIVYMGRIDQQVKIRGFRIEVAEVEHTLTKIDTIKEAVVMAREDRPGDQRLVAYVVPDASQLNSGGADWQQRWDTIYDAGVQNQAGQVDLDVVIAEQLSNQTDIREQADEWLHQSVKRLRALGAKRVLEVGSGAGQLLFELAPDTDLYIATDYAQTAIDNLNQRVAASPVGRGQVRGQMAMADDFSMVESGPAAADRLDLVLIHSVAQYFPDLRYFLNVLEGATKAVRAGGCVFVGDMQSAALQRQHHTADQLQRTADSQRLSDFRRIVDRRVKMDDELMADPAFFYLLPSLIPTIRAVDVQLREGKALNETTKYHFDVWLYVGDDTNVPTQTAIDATMDWPSIGSLDAVAQWLRQQPGQSLRLTHVPNARTASDHALLQALNTFTDGHPVSELKPTTTNVPEGINPNVFWDLAEEAGFRAHVRWANNGTDNQLEVVFIPANQTTLPPLPVGLSLADRAVREFINEPYVSQPTVSKEQIKAWRQQAAQSLPDYMLPTDFVVVPRFPITPNGKIDRKALPAPTEVRAEAATPTQTQPTTPEEMLLATLWRDILGVDDIGIDDNFFELGGHSMIAVQVMTRLEKQTGKRLPLASLFEYPTIRELATLLRDDAPAAAVSWRSLVPIRPAGTREPLYIVHGAGLNVLLFNAVAQNLHIDQPVYGLQARGLNGVDEPFRSITEMAEAYVAEILQHNPDGPYSLSGFSFGGIVAYEMARQLTVQGRKVSLVALFDAYAYDAGRNNPWWQRKAQGLSLFLNKVGHTLSLFKELRGQAIAYKMESIDKKLIKQYWLLKQSRRFDQVMWRNLIRSYWQIKFGAEQQEAIMDTKLRIEAINDVALEQFQLLPADLEVHLFRATIQTFYMDDYAYYGWRDFARKGVHVHDVPGEHSYIFAPPNDKEFAAKLQAVLDKRA